MRKAIFIVAVLAGACGPTPREAPEVACERLEVGELCSFVGRRGPVVGVCELPPASDEAVCVVQISEEQVACAGAEPGQRCAFEAAYGRVEGTCVGDRPACQRGSDPPHNPFLAEFLG